MYPRNDRSRPHVSIPAGALPPTNPSPSARSPYAFEVTPPPFYQDNNVPGPPMPNPWEVYQAQSPQTARPRTQSLFSSSRANLSLRNPTELDNLTFPEAQMSRATSARAALEITPSLSHHHSKSDIGPSSPGFHTLQREESNISLASSYYHHLDDSDQYATGSSEVPALLL